MRKVTYIIDDLEYFKKLYEGENNLEEILNAINPFRCEYTLIGEEYESEYLSMDAEGNKLNIDDLNGYQKGVVLADCQRHFQGKPLDSGGKMPTGCIMIKEAVLYEDQRKN